MNKELENEVLEDINKILIKLSNFEDVKFAHSEYGPFVPDIERIQDDELEEEYLDDKGNLKLGVSFESEYSGDTVKFKEQYENFKLSTIKTLFTLLINSKKQLNDAENILSQYYNSNC